MVLEDMVGCNIVCRSRQERIYVAGVATFSRRCRVHARYVSGVAASCYKAKAAVADVKAKLDVNTKRPQIKERKEEGWTGKKGIDVKADTLQLGQIVRGHEHGSILWLRLLFHQRGRNYDIYRGVGVEATEP